jgi:glucose/arabinose dehydrogenase
VTFTDGFDETTGIALSPDGALYVSSRGRITAYRDNDGDGAADVSVEIIGGLPNGRHQNNGLAFGPDGKLYITNGSTCDDCVEADERSATILQANPDGSALRVYATGLRNPYDIAFDGEGRLWATDNGSDEPCETVDELDLIEDGGDYGWPYGADGCDPFQDGSPPVASLGLHTASTGLVVYEAAHFPEAYRGGIFLTLWGSFFAEPELRPALYRVSLIADDLGGQPTGLVEEFASGFTNPIDVLMDRDGTLLVLDYGAEALYRIVYTAA